MDPLTIGLITGGASLLGSVFSSNTSAQNNSDNLWAQAIAQQQAQGFNAEQSRITRGFAADEAQRNRMFQDSESSTAYQRASKDMQAAGLNPMMMFGSGGAASTPSGSAGSAGAASISAPNMALKNAPSALGGLGDAVSKALNSAISTKTLDKMTEEISNLQAQQANIKAQTDATYSKSDLQIQQKNTEEQRTEQVRSEARKAGLQIPAAEFSAKQAKAKSDMPDWLIKAVEEGGYVSEGASKGFKAISDIPGVDILKKAFREIGPGSNARAVRRGMDLERDFNFGRN
jgi:hypothetical protein